MISGKAFVFHLGFLVLLLHLCFSVIVSIVVVIIFVHLYLQLRAHGEDCESTSYIWSVNPVTVEGNPLNSLSGASTALLVHLLSCPDWLLQSALSGLPSSLLDWLQKNLNNAAKGKSDHVTSLLEKLHWLPVEAHIHYKIATLAFRYFENSLSPYLSELLHTYQPSQTLQSSSNEKRLKVLKPTLNLLPNLDLSSNNCAAFHLSQLSRKI